MNERRFREDELPKIHQNHPRGLPPGQADQMRTQKWQSRLERARSMENFILQYCVEMTMPQQDETPHQISSRHAEFKIADLVNAPI